MFMSQVKTKLGNDYMRRGSLVNQADQFLLYLTATLKLRQLRVNKVYLCFERLGEDHV